MSTRRCRLIVLVQDVARPDWYWCDSCGREVVEVKTKRGTFRWRHADTLPAVAAALSEPTR